MTMETPCPQHLTTQKHYTAKCFSLKLSMIPPPQTFSHSAPKRSKQENVVYYSRFFLDHAFQTTQTNIGPICLS